MRQRLMTAALRADLDGGDDDCMFPDLSPLTGYDYGCRCPVCFRAHRYIGHRRKPSGAQRRKQPKPSHYIGPCRCQQPRVELCAPFDAYQCGICGMPIHDPRKEPA